MPFKTFKWRCQEGEALEEDGRLCIKTDSAASGVNKIPQEKVQRMGKAAWSDFEVVQMNGRGKCVCKKEHGG